ncbi:MAG: hypothetical protein O3A47_11980 [Chloroflexi bacterium]|nr:hypothetical protein [Chloroflexota bacterium]
MVLNAPIAMIFQEQDTEGMMAFGGGGTTWAWSPMSTFGAVATLDEEKRTEVLRVWKLLQTSTNIGLLNLPLRWWQSSLLRAGHEDKLIDAWIGLEGLFRNDYPERLASFLGADVAEAAAIKINAGISYGWRSKIVHAEDPAKVAKRLSLQKAVQLTTEYLRSALLKVLDLPGPFSPDALKSDNGVIP